MNHPLYLLRQVGRIPFPSLLSPLSSLFLTYRFAVIDQMKQISQMIIDYSFKFRQLSNVYFNTNYTNLL